MRRKLVAGNWKMHGSLAANESLLQALLKAPETTGGAECLVCAPFPYLAQTQELLRSSALVWGAQNLSEHVQGAYTGEISAAMLRDFGCRYVIVGHSERRTLYHETDAIVAAKFRAAQNAGLTPILCVGETLAQREQGAMAQVVTAQLNAIIEAAGAQMLGNAVIAYEPVWAIGTGRTASAQQAQEAHALIRARLAAVDAAGAMKMRVLYGGSVKPQNAQELFAMPDIDGGLIGGASLVAADFLAIMHAAS